MSENLKGKLFTGAVWSYIQRFSGQALQLLTSMFLARLVAPEEFGLIAMCFVFQGIAGKLADAGFASALMQKKNAEQMDYTSVFYLNIVLNFVLYGCLFVAAPYCASFFKEPKVELLIRVASVNMLIGPFGAVHGIIFMKEMIYKKPVIMGLICNVISSVVGISLAFAGWGVWALVCQGIFGTLFGTIAVWFISEWRPSLDFSMKHIKGLFSYGSKTMATGLLTYAFEKAYEVVVGKFYSATSLALYNRANNTTGVFSQTFYGVINGLTFPVFVKMQDDVGRLRLNVRKFTRIVAMIMTTVMFALLALGEPLFLAMYSSKWIEAVPYLKFTCVLAVINALMSINVNAICVTGHPGKMFKVTVIVDTLIIVSILLTYKYGIIYMYMAQLITAFISYAMYMTYTKRFLSYKIKEQMSDVLPVVGLTACFAVIVYLADVILKDYIMLVVSGEFLSSVIRVAICGTLYVFALFTYHRLCYTRPYSEFVLYFKEVLGNNYIFKKLERFLIRKEI